MKPTIPLALLVLLIAAYSVFRIRRLQLRLAQTQAALDQSNEQRSAQLQEAHEVLKSEIDERARAEQQLGDAEAHYLSLIENLPIHVIRKDMQGRFTFASASFCELLGQPLNKVLERTDFDFYPRELAEKYRADDSRVMQQGQVINDVEINQRADGQKSYVQVIKMPIFDAAGNVAGMQGIFWDVSARMRAEDQLRDSEERKRAILETAMDCMIFLDEQGVVVEANQSALETLRSRRQDVLGRPLAEMFEAEASRNEFRASLARYVADGHMGSMLGRHSRVDNDPPERRTFCRGDGHAADSLDRLPRFCHFPPRHHRAQAGGAGFAGREGGGRSGQPRQEHVSGEHESRDPHAAQRRDRHDRTAASDALQPRATRLSDDGPRFRRSRSWRHQRHPGLLQDRSGQAGARDSARSTCGMARRHDEIACRPGPREGTGTGLTQTAGRSASCWSATTAACGRSWSTSSGTRSSLRPTAKWPSASRRVCATNG